MSVRGPTLMSHTVNTLGDRVAVLKGLVWGDGPQGPEGTLRDPLMRQIGLAVTRHCPPRDDWRELEAIFQFVVTNVRYTGDIAGRDTFQKALRTLQYRGGDCDDAAVLNCVLAMENGFFCKVRITSNTGSTWDHIYAMAGIPKHRPSRYVALDTTLGNGKFAREPGRAKFVDFSMGTKDDER